MNFLTRSGSEKRRVCDRCSANRRLYFFSEDVNGFSKRCKVCSDPNFVHPKPSLTRNAKKSFVQKISKRNPKRQYCDKCQSYRRAYMFLKNNKTCGYCLGVTVEIPPRKNARPSSSISHALQKKISKKKSINKYYTFLRAWCSINPCIDCGEDDYTVLEFDHVRGKKVASISTIASGKGYKRPDSVKERRSTFKTLLEELQKCEVRCANCHRRKTAERLNYYA